MTFLSEFDGVALLHYSSRSLTVLLDQFETLYKSLTFASVPARRSCRWLNHWTPPRLLGKC